MGVTRVEDSDGLLSASRSGLLFSHLHWLPPVPVPPSGVLWTGDRQPVTGPLASAAVEKPQPQAANSNASKSRTGNPNETLLKELEV